MPYLREAVESILAQTFRDFELLLLDDGSTDDTPAYCRSIEDARLRYFRLEGNGLVDALNFGLREALAPVVARMDADDVSHPERLAKQLELMHRDNLVLLSCAFDRIDAEGHTNGRVTNLVTDEAIRWRMLFTPAFVHPGAMFDKESALRVGGYHPEFRVAQDFDLWTRLAACGRLGNHGETLLQYRQLDSCVSALNRDEQVKNASRAAARYASSICPDVSEKAWYELHRFSSVGGIPVAHSIVQLSRAFSAVRRLFIDRFGSECSELNASIAAFEKHLRWRSFDSSVRLGIMEAASRYRAARNFDPSGSRIGSIVHRRFKRFLNVKSVRPASGSFGPIPSQVLAKPER